jgi:hypothetical protein
MRSSGTALRRMALRLAIAAAAASQVHAQEGLRIFDSGGLPGSEGVVVRVSHPASWRRVPVDDGQVLAELRGPQGPLTGILQVGRGQRRDDLAAICSPERATTMLQKLAEQAPGTRVTDVFARKHEDRPAFEIRYERKEASGAFLAVHSLIVCLKDTRVLVSCGGTGPRKAALADIEPVCRQVLDSVRISED